MNEAQCWLRGEDARGPVSGCHTSTARGAPPGDPPGGQRHTPELAQGPRTQPPAPSVSFPRASCLHKPSAPRRVRGQERRGVGSDTVSSAASCGREPHGTRQRTRDRPELGAQLLPRERGCSDRLPEDSRRASARHRRPSAPGADPREHSRPPRAAAADPNTPLGSCSRHPATLPARGRLPSDTTCPSERTEEKQTDFK